MLRCSTIIVHEFCIVLFFFGGVGVLSPSPTCNSRIVTLILCGAFMSFRLKECINLVHSFYWICGAALGRCHQSLSFCNFSFLLDWYLTSSAFVDNFFRLSITHLIANLQHFLCENWALPRCFLGWFGTLNCLYFKRHLTSFFIQLN